MIQYLPEIVHFVVGFVFGLILMGWVVFNQFKSGVIEATRGRWTAKLVEKDDGTNEWKIEFVGKNPRKDTHGD